MSNRTPWSAALLGPALALGALLAPPAASAAPLPAPAWTLQALASPTHFSSAHESGLDRYETFLTNSGGAPSDGTVEPITIVDTLPKGLTVKSLQLQTTRQSFHDFSPSACNEATTAEVTTVTCKVDESLPEGKEPAKLFPTEQIRLAIRVIVPASETPVPMTNLVEAQGGGGEAVVAEFENEIDPECKTERECAPAGFEEYHAGPTGPDGRPVTQADSHPYQYLTSFAVNVNPGPPGAGLTFAPAGGDLKEIEVELPPGLIANPTAVASCTAQQFNTVHGGSNPEKGNFTQNECPDTSAVGLALVEQLEGAGSVGAQIPIYNLVPPKGMPAQFGFQPALGLPVYIDTAVRSGDRGLSARAFVHNVTEAKRLTASLLTFWGTPADPSHNRVRGQCAQAGGSCPPLGLVAKPMWRLPSSCEGPAPLTRMSFTSWTHPETWVEEISSEATPTGCGEPDFSPSIEAKPTTNVADSPSGLHVKVHLPQEEHQDPDGLGEADLRDATATLPPGLVVNPASADGLAACTPAQIGLRSAPGVSPVRFDDQPASCPPAAKVGKVQVTTPLLDHPVEGSVYLATQNENPFKSLIALYVAFEDPQTGTVIKLAGRVDPDPVSGRISSTFADNPEVPFEDFSFDFFEGARASLRTPVCGKYATDIELRPWTAPEGASANRSDGFEIGAGPEGPCPSGALAPKLSAGLASPTAGTYSPFSLRLTRPDGSGEFAAVDVSPPLGLTAKFAGIPYCPEVAIAQAASRSRPGQGAEEITSPSCPVASRVGTTSAGAGAGPTPFFTDGAVYLAGPYKGAPLSFVAIVPAVAGPFDLGVIVVRIAVRVDPETAQVVAQSDSLPRILYGIPLDVRDIRVSFDRKDFTLAGTGCDPKTVGASVLGTNGATANTSDRFQLGGCGALRFKPGLSLRLKGGTKRSGHPALKAIVTYPKGAYTNVASASVALPHSEFLDSAHLKTICTRVQFNSGAGSGAGCPAGSIYGKVRAITPLFEKPLEGPVYLRSSSNPLPDLVLALHGQVDFDAVGRIDSHKGGIRVSFDAVPDAPLTKVIVEMQGGAKGLLVNSRNICNHTNRATARFSAHNGKAYDFRPVLRDSCKGNGKKKRG